jgi:hypothetical protein
MVVVLVSWGLHLEVALRADYGAFPLLEGIAGLVLVRNLNGARGLSKEGDSEVWKPQKYEIKI